MAIAAGVVLATSQAATPAWAQGDSNVIVNLGAIEEGDGTLPPSVAPGPAGTGGRLLTPPKRPPASRFTPPDGALPSQPSATARRPGGPPPLTARPIPVPQPKAAPSKPRLKQPKEPEPAPKVVERAPAPPSKPKQPTPPAQAKVEQPKPVTPPAPTKLAPAEEKAQPKAAERPQEKKPEETAARAQPPRTAALTPPPPPAVKKPQVETKEVPAPPAVKEPETPREAPKAKVEEKPTQTAALPPKPGVEASGALSVAFPEGSSKLPAGSQGELKALADRAKGRENVRLQLLAYAGGEEMSSSKARRLSLSRALSVRSYLIDQGVRSTRIDVRALGNKVPSGDPNRVDVKIVER
jgi:outer membrane protein OmpA-like peptidoglycan-associated protein